MGNKTEISGRSFFIIITIASLFLIGLCAAINALDSDLTWTIATGREILGNGILRINPFTIDDLGIVVQQWLFDVLAALFSKMGHIGVYIFSCANTAALAAASWLCLRRFKISPVYKVLIMTVVCCLTIWFTPPSRPETTTIALLLFTCFSVDRYLAGGHIRILAVIPIAMLLEANLHSSMVWFHFAVIAAYLIPFPVKKMCNGICVKERARGRIKLILLFTAASAGAMFINPYGVAGVMYLPRSMAAGTFQYVEVLEMLPLFKSGGAAVWTAITFAVIAIAVYLACRGKLKNYQAYMTAGFAAITFMSVRNLMFMAIPLLFMLAQSVEQARTGEEKDSRSYGRRMLFISIVIIFLDIYISVTAVPEQAEIARGTDAGFAASMAGPADGFDEYDSYIRSNNDDVESIRIYTEFGAGGFFEYLGYRNLYLDARPELFMKELNGKEDILPTYSILHYGDIDAVSSIAPDFLERYDFDYLIVSGTGFRGYLDKDIRFEFITESGDYAMYEFNE